MRGSYWLVFKTEGINKSFIPRLNSSSRTNCHLSQAYNQDQYSILILLKFYLQLQLWGSARCYITREMVFHIRHVGGNRFVFRVHFRWNGVHADQLRFTTCQIHPSSWRHQRPHGMLLEDFNKGVRISVFGYICRVSLMHPGFEICNMWVEFFVGSRVFL